MLGQNRQNISRLLLLAVVVGISVWGVPAIYTAGESSAKTVILVGRDSGLGDFSLKTIVQEIVAITVMVWVAIIAGVILMVSKLPEVNTATHWDKVSGALALFLVGVFVAGIVAHGGVYILAFLLLGALVACYVFGLIFLAAIILTLTLNIAFESNFASSSDETKTKTKQDEDTKV